MTDQYSFQYCQKLVVFSEDRSSVLLCKRKGEADYDGTYSFIGGKMEISDGSIIEGLKREKDEEIGERCRVDLYSTFSINLFYTKADGNKMILPHYYAVFLGGEIVLSDEYSEYKWVPVNKLDDFEPKVPNIPDVVEQLQVIQSNTDLLDAVEI